MTKAIRRAQEAPFIVWLTGVSGSGKTTTFRAMEARLAHTSWGFLHLDGTWRPSPEELTAQGRPLTEDQDRLTHWWIEKVLLDYVGAEVVVVDGQSDLGFVEDACRHAGLNYAIILLECDWEKVSYRLIHQRQQSNFDAKRIQNWARYLRRQAVEKNALIIDTSEHSPEQVVDQILAAIASGESISGESMTVLCT